MCVDCGRVVVSCCVTFVGPPTAFLLFRLQCTVGAPDAQAGWHRSQSASPCGGGWWLLECSVVDVVVLVCACVFVFHVHFATENTCSFFALRTHHQHLKAEQDKESLEYFHCALCGQRQASSWTRLCKNRRLCRDREPPRPSSWMEPTPSAQQFIVRRSKIHWNMIVPLGNTTLSVTSCC